MEPSMGADGVMASASEKPVFVVDYDDNDVASISSG